MTVASVRARARSGTAAHRNLNLLRELALTQFKLKYTGSVLGYVWSLVKPAMVFGIMYLVFVRLLGAGHGVPEFPMQLLIGVVIWTFFADATAGALGSIITRSDLIQKAYFPRWILVLASTVSAFMTFLINFCIVTVVGVATGHLHPRAESFLVVPVVIELYVFIIGLGLLLASLNVFFRDIGHLWEIGSQLLFYGSAVVYPLVSPQFPHRLSTVLAVNPLAQMINDVRVAIVSPEIPTTAGIVTDHPGLVAVPFALVLAAVVLGVTVFNRQSPRFAEAL